MKNIAPDIYRQRLLIEAYYSVEITRERIEKYFVDIEISSVFSSA